MLNEVFPLGTLSRHGALLKRTLVLLTSFCAEIRSVSRTSIRLVFDRTWPHHHVTSPARRLHAAARILACSGLGE